MKNYELFIQESFDALEVLFDRIDNLLSDLRTDGMYMRYNEEIGNEEYYTFIKNTYDELSDNICKMCHTIGPMISETEEPIEKETDHRTSVIAEFASVNLVFYMKKHKIYTELYEEFKFFSEEAEEYFSKNSKNTSTNF